MRKSLKHELNPVNWEGLWWVLFIGPALFDSINSAQSPSLFRGSPLTIFTKMIVAGEVDAKSILWWKVKRHHVQYRDTLCCGLSYLSHCSRVTPWAWHNFQSQKKHETNVKLGLFQSVHLYSLRYYMVRNDEEHVLNFHYCHSMIEDVRSHLAESWFKHTNYPQDSYKMIWYTDHPGEVKSGRDSMRRKRTLSHWTRVWLEEYTPW